MNDSQKEGEVRVASEKAWCVKGGKSNTLLIGTLMASMGGAKRKLNALLERVASEDPGLPEDERGGPIMGETHYVVVPVTITEVDDRASLSSSEKDEADAKRGRWMLKNAAWHRLNVDGPDPLRAFLEIEVAAGADLSCYATREAALDAAMASASRSHPSNRGAEPDAT